MVFDDVLNTIFCQINTLKFNVSCICFLVVHFCSSQKVKRDHYMNILLLAPPVCSDMYFFIKM